MTDPSPPPLPLAGIRVVEFVHMIMGPSCGLVLGDLGAEVIKVEPMPDGDNTRRLTGSGAGFFVNFNRNKKSLIVDTKTPEGRTIVERLVATADVLTENFRPGAMEKLGLGWEQLKARYPRLIYASHKGFLDGPYEKRTALDEVVQMMGGLAYMTGLPGRPLRAGTSVNDIMGGMFAAIGVLAALFERQSTGKGKLVRSALFENCAFLVSQHMAAYAMTGKALPPMSIRVAAWAIYDVFETKDGQQIFFSVVTDSQWVAFCEAVGWQARLADPVLKTNNQRVAARPTLLPEVEALLRTMTRDEIVALAERAGLPYAPITRPEDLFDDPHLKASGGLAGTALPDGRRAALPILPLDLDRARLPKRLDPPRPGEHSVEILEALGYAQEEIDRLAATGVVQLDRPPATK
ncbi:MAG: CoA transferase [Alphaproteobacteria bacterium]|nr:CoA transferase [Alphaproteobacteria bacterium]